MGAQSTVERFQALCELLSRVDVTGSGVSPELSQNVELRKAVVSLEEVWDQSQHVLRQQALDFLEELLSSIRSLLDPWFRWNLKLAVTRKLHLKASLTQEEEQASEVMFSTLPVLLCLQEMRKV